MINIEEAKKRIESVNSRGDLRNRTRLNTDHEVPFVENEAFRAFSNIIHGFSTRLGGVSAGIYESMNLGLYLDDERANVIENYKRFSDALGVDYERISCPNQIHNSNVLVVTNKDAGDGITRDLSHKDVDAQITNEANIPLIVYSADCVPILFCDPVKNVIGSAHAGWRGTVAGIAAKVVNKMQDVYGSDPKDIRALIGPSISMDNYEVDENVINEVKNCEYINMSDGSDGLYRTVKSKGKYMLNLWAVNELILTNAGLNHNHIYNTNLCTFKNHDLFFSHRYTAGKRGLNAGIIMIDG
ncbi:MAG: peptidoglycan editing factor PgeF [Lachnospiraceae bacterium]|nr:peptidoglycan editing factor PgeF [Lachnospiraceae bacterium]